MRAKYFTKHLFRVGLQCPAKLYYKACSYPEDIAIRPFLEHAGFNGYNLKKLAALQYPESVVVRGKNREEAFSITKKLLEKDAPTLFNASFISRQCYAKATILQKNGRHVKLSDIRTKVINPRKHTLLNNRGELYNKWKQYVIDIAYKVFVIRQLYPEWKIESFLILPDKTKVAANDMLLQKLQNNDTDLDLDDEELLCTLEVSAYVNRMLESPTFDKPYAQQGFAEVLQTMKEQFYSADWQQPQIGKKCRNCEFQIASTQVAKGEASGFNRCWSGAAETPVIDLIGPGINSWMESDIFLQKNVPLSDLPPLESIKTSGRPITQKQRQTLQVRKAKGQEIPAEIIKQPAFDEINRWEFPLHFLDFEAGNYAVPLRRGRRPYHLVLFQFSCHTLYEDGRREHHQWIDDGGEGYSNYDLIRQLIKVPDIGSGTIVQYSNFERYALKTIRKELKREADQAKDAEALIQWLDGIVQRHDSNHINPPYLADLSRLVKNYYYNREMQNSLSIKDVLKSVLSVSDFLKAEYSEPYKSDNFESIRWWQQDEADQRQISPYQILRRRQNAAAVGRGTEAMVLYGKILTGALNRDQKKGALQSLQRYCELDTLAMVMIYEHWKNLV
jgi:hypothetical protein